MTNLVHELIATTRICRRVDRQREKLVDESISDDETGRLVDQPATTQFGRRVDRTTKLVDELTGDDETGRRNDRRRRNWSTSRSATMKQVDESIGDDKLVDESIHDDKTGRRVDQRRRKLVDKSIGDDKTGQQVNRRRRNRSTSRLATTNWSTS